MELPILGIKIIFIMIYNGKSVKHVHGWFLIKKIICSHVSVFLQLWHMEMYLIRYMEGKIYILIALKIIYIYGQNVDYTLNRIII